jgi:hypothetical protein
MTAPGDAARCHLVPGRSFVGTARPTADPKKRDRRGGKIKEGANTSDIANRDQKPGDGPSDILLMLTIALSPSTRNFVELCI